ncbi:MAG: molybdopterin-dependent oxidoreductase [Sedimentitalea sp.]
MPPRDRALLTSSHWGTYRVNVKDGHVTSLDDFEEDRDPSPIGHGIVDVLEDDTRIKAPMVRKSWLKGGPGTNGEKRGKDDFVEVRWDEVNRLVANELTRVRQSFGNSAIYAGSYGWASAGRFHHAQSQLKRFLNCIGGFTSSKNTYSFAAAEVVVPHVLGTYRGHLNASTSWETIAAQCEVFVAFGGVPLKNGQITQGGTGDHVQRAGLMAAHAAGVQFVNISPLREDIAPEVGADWLAIRPGTDVALMLALCQVLLAENLHDPAFLDRYTHGFERFAAYLRGDGDGTVKSPEWAADICDVPPETIRALARRMGTHKTMISVAWALTRQDHGEQPFWAAIALTSMLGQLGLPGTGLGFGYSAMNDTGLNRHQINYAALPQGENPVTDFIPVARITEMLENPGGPFDYDGVQYTYPDIRLIWWAGGNPFHHHQDLNRMRKAWAKPDTIIVNEWCWNALAKHADIVLPCTTPLERQDIAMSPKDPYLVAMDPAIAPVGQARDDHDILRGIAAEMGVEDDFTDGRTPENWLRWLWDTSRQRAAADGFDLPDWDTFQKDGWYRLPNPQEPTIMFKKFREDPDAHPLDTPSGKIELFSDTIDAFGYQDCPGHPTWFEPVEWLGHADPSQLHLISNQPKNKLHSQLDHGSVSRAGRPNGYEAVLMQSEDAADRGLCDGQIVRLSNQRGSCLAELRVSDTIRKGVVQLATGAWFNPQGSECLNGNPNVLTIDKGTSRLAQGPIAHSCLVTVAPVSDPI